MSDYSIEEGIVVDIIGTSFCRRKFRVHYLFRSSRHFSASFAISFTVEGVWPGVKGMAGIPRGGGFVT